LSAKRGVRHLRTSTQSSGGAPLASLEPRPLLVRRLTPAPAIGGTPRNRPEKNRAEDGPARGVIDSPAPLESYSALAEPELPVSYSTVTDFARFRGWSTLHPRATAT
jgi:hypothetical protein